MAATGEVYPSSAESVADGAYSDEDWIDVDNIKASDGNVAVCGSDSGFDSGEYSYLLRGYSFDFSAIPDDATIDGVICRIWCWTANANEASFEFASLSDAFGGIAGDNEADGGWVHEFAAPVSLVAGAADNNWGNALTPAWVKSEDFSIYVSFYAAENDVEMSVDCITLEVYYTEAPEPSGGSISHPRPSCMRFGKRIFGRY